MSTAMWKLEKDLCRCCHAEGSFKHLSDPCFLLGQEEIYSVMLQDSLAVKIVPMTGPLSDATYTICESCVVRLRDASNFKRQVQDCEERFKEMYSKNLIRGFDVKEELDSDEDMKQEGIAEDDDDDDDDDDAFMKFDDDAEADDSFDEHEEMVTVEVPKAKGKGKAKPKPKPKKATPVKKTKTKEKPIKLETEELTEAAVSGEKKKGLGGDYLKFCTITEEGESKIFKCDICDKPFKKRRLFHQHLIYVHLKQRKTKRPCVICRVMLVPSQKAKHMEEVHGWHAPTCRACDKKFSYPNQLQRHLRVFHMGERNFECEHCDMAFANRQALLSHSAKHSDVRPFVCEYCSKAFKTRKTHAAHVNTHKGEERYECSICDAAFLRKGSLKHHMMKNHPNDDIDSTLDILDGDLTIVVG